MHCDICYMLHYYKPAVTRIYFVFTEALEEKWYSDSEIIKNRTAKENKPMPTLTIIISLIILAVYIFLLVAKQIIKVIQKQMNADGCTGSLYGL